MPHKKKCDICKELKLNGEIRTRHKTIEQGRNITYYCKKVFVCNDCLKKLDKKGRIIQKQKKVKS